MVADFKVPGAPQGKARPRATVRGGHAAVYTPKKTVEYENQIRSCYMQAHKNKKFPSPLRMDIVAIFEVPKSYSSKKRAACLGGEVRPTCKPDMDNIVKCVADALNGVAYDDDSGIADLTIAKRYGPHPMVLVRLSANDAAAQEEMT